MKRTYKKKSNLINKTGYTPGYDTEKNPVNYIPSEDITMANTPYPLYATPLDENGNPIGRGMMMKPGGEYKFPGAAYVAETPMFAKGGEKSGWISDKISTLVKEGYPQKQAVAIAYSMYEDMKKEQGGKMLPKYQAGKGNPFEYKSPFGTPFDFTNMGSNQKSTPGKEVLAYPVSYYNGPDLGTLPNPDKKPEYTMPGQLPSFESLFNTSVNADSANTTTPKTNVTIPLASNQEQKPTELREEVKSLQSVLGENFKPQPTNYEAQLQDLAKKQSIEVGLSKEEEGNNLTPPDIKGGEPFQFFNPYSGFDIPTAASTLGSSIESGDTLGTVGSGLKLATGLARNFFGGMGQQRRRDYLEKQYYEKQREGMTGTGREQMLRFGGYYQEGGEGDMVRYGGGNTGIEKKDLKSLAKKYNKTPEQFLEIISEGEVRPDGGTMLRIGGANTGVPANWREEYKKSKPSTTGFRGALNKGLDYIGVDPIFNMGGYYQDGGEQQLAQQVAQAIQQGMQPQEAMSMLMESGMTEDQALQMVQAIMQQLQQPQSTPQLRGGGMMYYQDGGNEPSQDPTEMMMQQVAQMLQQGAQPEQIMQMLIEAGVPEDQAMQMVQSVLQQIETTQQPQGTPQLKRGGEMMDEEMEGENETMENESAMLEQVESQVEQALKQGTDPQQVLQQLVQMGIPQEVAQQMIQEILQEIQGGETEMEAPETPQMSKGGKYMRALVGKTIKNYTYNPKTDSYIVSYE